MEDGGYVRHPLLLHFYYMTHDKKAESFVAVCSFFAAVALAFTSLIVSTDHDIAAGVLMMCAQFLLLTATIFGLDYHIIKRISESKDT